MTGLSITSGSMGGGYDLVISGRNMAEAFGSTNVFIGTAINALCEVT